MQRRGLKEGIARGGGREAAQTELEVDSRAVLLESVNDAAGACVKFVEGQTLLHLLRNHSSTRPRVPHGVSAKRAYSSSVQKRMYRNHCMYVCIYVCMYVCMYVCTSIHTYVCIYVCICVCVYMYVHTCSVCMTR